MFVDRSFSYIFIFVQHLSLRQNLFFDNKYIAFLNSYISIDKNDHFLHALTLYFFVCKQKIFHEHYHKIDSIDVFTSLT